MTRETTKITLPTSKLEVEIKSYVTGGEKQELMKFLMRGASIDPKSSTINGDIKIETVMEANDKAIEMLVVSFNGSKENILQSVKDLRVKDYDYLKTAIDAVSNDQDFLTGGQK